MDNRQYQTPDHYPPIETNQNPASSHLTSIHQPKLKKLSNGQPIPPPQSTPVLSSQVQPSQPLYHKPSMSNPIYSNHSIHPSIQHSFPTPSNPNRLSQRDQSKVERSNNWSNLPPYPYLQPFRIIGMSQKGSQVNSTDPSNSSQNTGPNTKPDDQTVDQPKRSILSRLNPFSSAKKDKKESQGRLQSSFSTFCLYI